jgi:hypothetical protein
MIKGIIKILLRERRRNSFFGCSQRNFSATQLITGRSEVVGINKKHKKKGNFPSLVCFYAFRLGVVERGEQKARPSFMLDANIHYRSPRNEFLTQFHVDDSKS